MAKKKLTRLGRAIFGTPPSALELEDATVKDESNKAGVAFGELMRCVGLAVAETQAELNKTSAESATKLANTAVDVVVARQDVYDDTNGNLVDAHVFVDSLPLINFVDPVFYEWPAVRLQGNFVATSFKAASATNTTTFGANGSVSGGKGKRRRKPLTVHVDAAASNTNVTSAFSSESSYGQMRMTAALRPRRDVVIPKPRVVRVGPRIEFFQGTTNPNDGQGHRTMDVTIKYSKKDANGISGIGDMDLSIFVTGAALSYLNPDGTPASGVLKTSDVAATKGELRILLSRDQTVPEAPVTITVRKNFVSNEVTVQL